MKRWFDVVLQYGWALGKGGAALKGKSVTSVITTGEAPERPIVPKGTTAAALSNSFGPLSRLPLFVG